MKPDWSQCNKDSRTSLILDATAFEAILDSTFNTVIGCQFDSSRSLETSFKSSVVTLLLCETFEEFCRTRILRGGQISGKVLNLFLKYFTIVDDSFIVQKSSV